MPRSIIGVPYGDTMGPFDAHWCAPMTIPCMGKADSNCPFRDRLTESQYVTTIFQWQNVVFVALCLFAFALGKIVYRLPFLVLLKRHSNQQTAAAEPECEALTGFIANEEILEKANHGVAVSFSGFVLGLAMITLSAITDTDQGENINRVKWAAQGSSQGWDEWSLSEWNKKQGLNVGLGLLWVTMGLIFLIIARFTNDFLTTEVIETVELKQKQNVAVGCLEGAAYICTGMTVAAAISGRHVSVGEDLASSTLFFVLGQLHYCINFSLFKWLEARSGLDISKELREDNAACAILVGFNQISYAMVMSSAIFLSDSLVVVIIAVSIGMVALTLLRFFADFCILPDRSLMKEIILDDNWGVAFVAGAVLLSSATTLSGFFPWICDDMQQSLGERLTDTSYLKNAFSFKQGLYIATVPGILVLARHAYWFPYHMRQKRKGVVQVVPVVAMTETAASTDDPGQSQSTTDNGSGSGSGNGSGRGADMLGVQAGEEGDSGDGNEDEGNLQRAGSNVAMPGSLDHALTNSDNKAVNVAFAGYLIALCFIWNGATEGDNDGGPDIDEDDNGDQAKEYVVVLMFLLLGQAMLLLTHYAIDYVVLYKFSSIDNMLKRTNSTRGTEHDSAVGVVEAGAYIGSGIIIQQSQYGWVSLDSSDGWGEAIGCMFFYWALGQLMVIVFIKINITIMNSARHVFTQIEIKEGNYAVALRLASDIVAMSVCIGAPLGMSDSLVTFAVYASLGLTLLISFHFFIRASFVPFTSSGCMDTCLRGKHFKDDWGAALVEGVCTIALAKLFTTFMRPCNCYQAFV